MRQRRTRRQFRISVAGVAAAALVAAPGLPAAPATAAPDPAAPDGAGPAAVAPQVRHELAGGGSTDFWVYLEETADLTRAGAAPDRGAQGRYAYEQLTATAERTQAGLLRMLDAEGADYDPYWIANTVRVTGDEALLERIAALPEVARIDPDEVYELPEPIPAGEQPGVASIEWGLDNINAAQVWDEFHARGQGIVVGAIDSGALYTHDAIVGQYRGNLGNGEFDHNYNWWDPSEVCGSPSVEPCDNEGHGTHVIGTMTGDDGGGNQIGVAPEAQWIVAKGCETNNCSTAALLSAGQFIFAPTDLDGNNANPDLRPHIVNNSWGGGADADPWYQQTVRNWVSAGIFPVFSAGNTDFGVAPCGSASNPGNLAESYAVGAHDATNTLGIFSNRGFSAWDGQLVKPDISAPGVGVRSAWNDGSYHTISGTSMAAPHVAGTVALMWSAAEALERDVEGTRDLLDTTAIDTGDLTCGGTPEDNNMYGEGRLDAFAAVDASPRGDAGTLTGTVTDAGTGEPIAGATVAVSGAVERERVTGPDGTYTVNLPVGDYDVTAKAFTYLTQAAGVTIVTDETTTHDFPLEPGEVVPVTGRVTDGAGHGWPLYAEVRVDGTTAAAFTDPYTGEFHLALPPDASYTLTVQAEYPGYETVTETVRVGSGDLTVDVAVPLRSCRLAPGYERGPTTVGVMGDFDGQLASYLDAEGIRNAPVQWGDDVSGFDTIVVNRANDPGEEAFLQFLADTDAAGTGLVLLDTWTYQGYGVWLLHYYAGNPPQRGFRNDPDIPALTYQVVAEHPVLAGFEVGDEIVLDQTSESKDHAWFDGYTGEGTTVLANAARSDTGVLGQGIAVQQRDNNRHALLSMHGTSPFSGPPVWHPDSAQVFRNALEWTAPGADFECRQVGGGLVAGQVRDLNTGTGMAGATVTNVDNPQETTTSSATPDDPDLDDGFFWMFTSAGSHKLTAAAGRYVAETEPVQVPAGGVAAASFDLAAGQLALEPADLGTTVRLGQSRQQALTITNTGTADASLELAESGGSFEILGGTGGGTTGAGDEITLSHSLSPEIVPGNTTNCGNFFGSAANAYLRAFALPEFDITGEFEVRSVSFAVDRLSTTHAMDINLYTLEGEFISDNLELIGTTEVTLQPQAQTMVTVPVTGTARPGSTVVAEIDVPSMAGFGEFFPGSNPHGQTAPSYHKAPICNIDEPTDFADLGHPRVHLVMSVTGAVVGDQPWLELDTTTATLAPGQRMTVSVAMDSAAAEQQLPGTYAAELALVHDTPYVVPDVPVRMEVTPPHHWGAVTGTVTGTGCDGAETPAAGATIQLDSRRGQTTLIAGPDGRYIYWLPVNHNPLTLKVAASAHEPQTRKTMIIPRRRTVEDFVLSGSCG